jgi:hypothetical protein
LLSGLPPRGHPIRIPRAEANDNAKSFSFNNLEKLGTTDFGECVAAAPAIRCAAPPAFSAQQ